MQFDLSAKDVVVIVAALKELEKSVDENSHQAQDIKNVLEHFKDVRIKVNTRSANV